MQPQNDAATALARPRPSPGPQLYGGLASIGLRAPVLLLFAALAIGPLLTDDEYIIRLFVISLLFGTQAMVFDFTGGFINAVNFGFAAFVGLGAYTSALLGTYFGLSPWLGLIAGALAAGLLGLVTGVLTLPLRGIYVSLMAWFVGMTLMGVTTAMVKVTRGAQGLIVQPLMVDLGVRSYYYLLFAIAVGMYLVLRLIIHSHIGLAFRAIGQNYEAARASGVDPTRTKLINFTLSCACAGLLGGYYGHFMRILTPDVMDMSHTMEIMALSYMGGSGSLLGGWVAAFLFVPVFDYLKSLMEFRLIIYGLCLILVMIFYPAGLAGGLGQLSRLLRVRWRGRRA